MFAITHNRLKFYRARSCMLVRSFAASPTGRAQVAALFGHLQPQVRASRSSDGHCAAGACPPALLAVCARRGGQCGVFTPSDAISSEGHCVRFLAAHFCERAPPAQIQRTRVFGFGLPHSFYQCIHLPPCRTLAAAAQAAAAALISGMRGRTRACCAVTADPTTYEMRGNRRNVATG